MSESYSLKWSKYLIGSLLFKNAFENVYKKLTSANALWTHFIELWAISLYSHPPQTIFYLQKKKPKPHHWEVLETTNQPASHNNKTSKFLQTSTIIAKISAFFHTFHTYIILTYLDVLPTMLLFFESIKDYPVIYCKTLKHGIAVLRNTSIFPFSSLFSYLRQFRFPSNRWPTPD